jgi:hypothetical protein
MKTIRPHVWIACFAVLGIIVLCTMYFGTNKHFVVEPSQAPSAEQQTPTQAHAQTKAPVASASSVDPKAADRARLLAQLGFAPTGGHKVSVIFTNSSGETPTAQ